MSKHHKTRKTLDYTIRFPSQNHFDLLLASHTILNMGRTERREPVINLENFVLDILFANSKHIYDQYREQVKKLEESAAEPVKTEE